MEDFLKGNYKVDVEIKDKKINKESKYKEQAINSIGGSMVFVEREILKWDGDNKVKENENE
jgi:hypothetical protein